MMHKGKIRPPRKIGAGRAVGVDNYEENWRLIRDALDDIHNQNAGKLSFEQLYRASYKIVLMKRGEELYMRVKEFEERYFAEKVIPQIWEHLVTQNLVAVALHNVPGTTAHERRAMGEKFLRGTKEAWERHNTSMNMVADVLMYLDRGYAQDATRPFIYATTIGLFRDQILHGPLPPTLWTENDRRAAELRASSDSSDIAGGDGAGVSSSSTAANGAGVTRHPTILTVLTAVILDQINMDRDGDVIDRTLLRSCVAMLEALYETDEEHEDEKLYTTLFEPDFLHATRRYYRAECARLLRNGDARAWLRQTRSRLREEQDRCGHTVSQESRGKTAHVLEQELIAAHVDDFMAMDGSGLKAMVDNDRMLDLGILYELVSRVEAKKLVFRNALQARIIDMGREIEKALNEIDFSVAPTTAADAATTAAGAAGVAPGDEGKENIGKAAPLSASAQQTAAAIKWVNDILDLKEKFDKLWVECFDRDLAIQTAITSSFTELFRLCTRSAEYVSLFIDDSFKRGLRGKSDAEVDVALDKATIMVQHVTEKDMLERYYQKHLARRLLHNKSENPEAEKLLISRMQSALGKTFTAKFEGMFRDMATSAELTRDYAKYAKDNLGDDAARVDLAVNVLTSNNWPAEVMGRMTTTATATATSTSETGQGRNAASSSSTGCIYPPEIRLLQQSFLKFYLRNRSGRVLSWVGSAGSADMKCVFPRIAGHEKGPLSRERRYELNAPTHGMIVLLLFNNLPEGAKLGFAEIQAQTNIAAPDLTRVLASLSIPPKCRVLLKEPATKNIKPTDTFAFNAQFVSKTVKIKVPVINALSKVEGDDERKVTEEKNNQTRAHTIDAAIVRIMKQRKELTHAALTAEVLAQLRGRFHPDVAMVKKRIEDLIAREYLERIEDTKTPSYRYVA
ncbi:scf ubiquitin ligase subunit [Niveomyces insectorum RCEF 264]|uniref:Scf ubiquitin ligase subunit n=1 Tax=Niveomyces insectorum RCEF 264 TaxID=1081102 RepID=A0A167Z2H3_9HYPO|nr:scf ubiquitin ligase subunit [Niveomyces insectorum RCEF 264]